MYAVGMPRSFWVNNSNAKINQLSSARPLILHSFTEFRAVCVLAEFSGSKSRHFSAISFRRNISHFWQKFDIFFFYVKLGYIRQDIISVILDVIEHGAAKSQQRKNQSDIELLAFRLKSAITIGKNTYVPTYYFN